MKSVRIYTDGACSGNPGPGGWGAILVCEGKEKVLSGGETPTTNNRMELTAAVRALLALKRPCKVDLFSDSSYLVNALTKGWLENWIKKGWRKADGSPVLTPDLWQELLSAAAPHDLTWHWVKGHAGHEYNERCDRLAVGEIKKLSGNGPEEDK